MLIRNAMVAFGGKEADGWLLIQNGIVAAVGHGVSEESGADVFDASGNWVVPGFVDVHNHGAVGVDVNAADVDGLVAVAEFLARNGVTAWMPTIVPDSDENYRRIIDVIDRLMEIQTEMPIAQAVGVHYEGVFANETMCGALRPEYFKKGGQWSVAGGQLPKLREGVHFTTLAPEVDGGLELIRGMVADGWIASIGHTKASVEILDQAFAAGARHLTHFYNAMTGLHHRDVGVVGWAFANKDLTFDIIADGIHVHPKPLEFACRAKGCDKVSLISDSVAPTGLGDGEFELWGERISVKNGRTQNERGSIAGSVITMHDAVRQMFALGFSTDEIEQMATLNPARLLGLEDSRGSLEAGKRADVVFLNAQHLIEAAWVGGKRVTI